MEYFNNYVSNTVGASANQLHFTMNNGEKRTGRVFYKIFASGEYDYSLLFSNIIDSTYADGSLSHKNLICENWHIFNAKIGVCKSFNTQKNLTEIDMASDVVITGFKEISFNGFWEKTVMPGEFFTTDPVKLSFDEGDYLCLEMTYSGKMIPYHEESLLPIYVKDNENWKYMRLMPLPSMIGCNRKVSAKIGFFGDSITQGIGPEFNSYLHWSALISEKIGKQYSYWNLGIGFGRANDAASDGAWMYKAKKMDILFVCFGVNDLMQQQPEAQIISDLTAIVNILKKQGVKVILQSIPPFDYSGETLEKWKRINQYVKETLSKKVDVFFDIVPHVCESAENAHLAKYGGHPDNEGSKIWAEALFEHISTL